MNNLKETNSCNQQISKDSDKNSIKDFLQIFFAEFGFQLFFLLLIGTTTGIYFLLGFYVIIGIIPIGLMVYYLLKNK